MSTIEVDGRPVALLDAGGGDAPPLVLLHGFTGAKEDFAAVIGLLAADRRVVACDLPGHGDSEGLDDPDAYGLEATATWALRTVDVLGLGDFHLLGHSLGGLVAQRAAAAASHRLRSLVLSGSGLGAVREEAAEAIVRVAVAARDEGLEAAFAESQRAMEEAGVDRAAVAERAARADEIRERYLRLEPSAVVGGARSLITAVPLGAFLRGIDLPVLVIHGVGDYGWTPGEQALLAATVPRAERAAVPDSFHSPQRENPQRWAETVADFLRRVDRGRRAG